MGLLGRFWPSKKEDNSNQTPLDIIESSIPDDISTNKYLQTAKDTLPQCFVHSTETLLSADHWTSPQRIALATCSVGAFGLGIVVGRKSASFSTQLRRITNVHEIQSIGPESPLLRGQVVKVSDGDTFRFYHTPTMFHSATPDANTKLSDQALAIRICTIDTPEVAKVNIGKAMLCWRII